MRILLMTAILLQPALCVAQTAAAAKSTTALATPVNVVLSNDVEARRAKPGSAVKAKAYSGFTTADGTRIPPGATLLGQVTEATTLGKGSIESRLGVRFQQIQLSTGQLVPIQMGIAGIAAPPPIDLSSPELDMGPDRSSYPGKQQNVDSNNAAGGVQIARTTGSIKTTERPASEETGRPVDNPLRGDHVAGIATVGSTVPGISLQGNGASGMVLVSTSKNIALRSGTPLVLTVLTEPQR